ncbi:hypothetical protein LB505_007126 [Fusarium chuoi]|nr:hypothetical protein LB505_007126 [Fusarium chuoi]
MEDAYVDGSTFSSSNRVLPNYHKFLKLTELDVLDTIETIKVAIAYKIDGARARTLPCRSRYASPSQGCLPRVGEMAEAYHWSKYFPWSS